MADDHGKVGRGRPPAQHQFQRGKSGNPRGRPKGARNLAIELTEELNQKVRIREGDKESYISKQRAIIKAMVAKALKGDTRAALTVLTVRARLIDDNKAPGEAVSASDQALLDEYIEREVAKRTRGAKNTSGDPHKDPE